MENQKRKRALSKKKKENQKKVQSRKEEYQSVKKRKKSPLWKRAVSAELHAGIQISNKEVAVEPNFAAYNVKNEVLLLFMQVPALTRVFPLP